ncbi:MAG: hypothetical protein HEP71_03770 [Roseivirga sp.]|nr:hypothetical protein [Roseivirga sp.]
MQISRLTKISIVLIGVFLCVKPLWGQANASEEPEVVEWKEGRLLTWEDYRLRVFKSNKGQLAITSVRHSVRGYLNDDIPDFEVKVLFVKDDSWTTDKTDSELLAHERLHFDIGELFRRRIVKRINGLRKQGEKQKAIYRYVIRKELSEFRIFSKSYDKATRHGSLPEEQQKWQKDVWEQLKRLQ